MIARRAYGRIVTGCLVILMTSSAGVFLAQTQIRPGFNLFSVEQDQEIGRESAREAERQLPILQDRSIETYVNAVGGRLAAVAPGARYPYQFKVVNASDINAFALPGGFLYVNRGLIEAAQSEGQLAGVMAHEIAHVALRHGTNQASKAYLAQTGLGLLGGLVGDDDGSGARKIATVGGFGLNALFLKFSRTAEEQADVTGAQILAEAGYDPDEMVTFFEMLADKNARDPSKVEQFFSSHPPPSGRAARVNREMTMLTVRPTPPVGGFAQVRSELLGMSPAASMQEITSGQGTTPATREPRSADRSVAGIVIDPPSSEFRVFEQRTKLFRMGYPANWRIHEASRGYGVTIAPEGGFVDSGGGEPQLVYGAIVNHYEPFDEAASGSSGASKRLVAGRTSLDRATNDLLGQILRTNPGLSVVRKSERRGRVDGAPSLSVVLSGRSEVTRREERVTVLTRQLPDDHVLYALFIAPGPDYGGQGGTFDRMIASLRVGDETTHRSSALQGPNGPLSGSWTAMTVPSGTVLSVEFQQTLSSADSRPGDRFTARVVEPVLVNGRIAIEAGSIVSGRVVTALPSKKLGGRARLDLEFTSLKPGSGGGGPISASFHGEGKSQTKKDAAAIGGAAVGGALLGRILGKDTEGAVVGALVGGAIGTGIAASNTGEEVTFPEGMTIEIRLDSPFQV